MISVSTLLALFVVAFVAACADAIAGGGGLLTLPALLLIGLDPVAALATSKLQSTGGSVSATIAFARRGLLGHPQAWAFAGCTFLAAIAGARCVALLPRDLLAVLMPIVLIGVAAYFALARRPSTSDVAARAGPLAFAVYAAAIGFYDGIFGPGAGSFYMIGFVSLLGYGVVRSTAHTKLANAASNLGALVLFAASGRIVWTIGLVMLAGAILGGQVGSHLAIRHGARLIRPLLVAICCTMAIKLLLEPANPLRHLIADLIPHGAT